MGVILAAEAGVIFVSVFVEAFDRFQAADGREVVGVRRIFRARDGKITGRAVKTKQVIDKRYAGDGKDCGYGNSQSSSTLDDLVDAFLQGDTD